MNQISTNHLCYQFLFEFLMLLDVDAGHGKSVCGRGHALDGNISKHVRGHRKQYFQVVQFFTYLQTL
jgi:hypothetical protein